jgi:hypothetical protein
VSFLPAIVGLLPPGVLRRDAVVIDACAEAAFLQSLDVPGASLELVSPSGQRFTPADTVSGAVRYVRDDDWALQKLTVINPEPGSWVAESSTPPAGPTQEFELLPAVDANVTLRIASPSDAPTPGSPVTIQAWLDFPSGPDPTATLSGTVLGPNSTPTTLSFQDDGSHGDGVAGDGIFGATYVPDVTGGYGVFVQAAHSDGAGESLSRARTAAFVVEAAPDLAIAASDISFTRDEGNSLIVTATIHNLGTVDADGGKAVFLNASGLAFHSEVLNVPAGGQASVTAVWTPGHSELDTLIAVADDNFAFLQARYDNDTARVVISPALVAVQAPPPPSRLSLAASYPNPMQQDATIIFTLPHPAGVGLRIYDVAGRLVRTLLDGIALPAGSHSVHWNGRMNDGHTTPAGVYFYRLCVGRQILARRLVIVR